MGFACAAIAVSFGWNAGRARLPLVRIVPPPLCRKYDSVARGIAGTLLFRQQPALCGRHQQKVSDETMPAAYFVVRATVTDPPSARPSTSGIRPSEGEA